LYFIVEFCFGGYAFGLDDVFGEHFQDAEIKVIGSLS